MDCSPPVSPVHGILWAKILEWAAMPSSRGSSQPRDQTQVTGIAGGFFTIWATREAPICVCMCVCVYICTHIYGWRQWQPTPVFLPGESHGQRSLADYSPWGCKELDMTERLIHTHTHTHTTLVVKHVTASAGDVRDAGSVPGLGISPGGGQGNPPQYSCPEKPMDRGAWWAIVHRIAKDSDMTEVTVWHSIHIYVLGCF